MAQNLGDFFLFTTKYAGSSDYQLGSHSISPPATINCILIFSTLISRLRIVPKAGTAVSFEISGKLVTLDAGIMAMKPADRAVKKWKNRAPLPL